MAKAHASTLHAFLHDPRVRAVARTVPGLSRTYHGIRRWLTLRRGVAEIDYERSSIRVRTPTKEIVRARLHPVAKEPWTVEWIERNLRPGDVFYDIGANVGGYSLIAASVNRLARIVAFEPAYATYASLCDNLVLNGVSDVVTALPVVLAERTRLGSLGYQSTAAGAALHALDGDGVYRQPVLVYSLDDLIDRFDLPPPTLVKLDVDGAEEAVLAGARAALRRAELRSLVVEVDHGCSDAVQTELRDAGFGLARRVEERDGQPIPGAWYGIFERT